MQVRTTDREDADAVASVRKESLPSKATKTTPLVRPKAKAARVVSREARKTTEKAEYVCVDVLLRCQHAHDDHGVRTEEEGVCSEGIERAKE